MSFVVHAKMSVGNCEQVAARLSAQSRLTETIRSRINHSRTYIALAALAQLGRPEGALSALKAAPALNPSLIVASVRYTCARASDDRIYWPHLEPILEGLRKAQTAGTMTARLPPMLAIGAARRFAFKLATASSPTAVPAAAMSPLRRYC